MKSTTVGSPRPFGVPDGVSDDEAVELLAGVHRDGLDALHDTPAG
ncbi:hypothetical protein ABZW30_30840 [Kitasatospora sp. NPDC004669]